MAGNTHTGFFFFDFFFPELFLGTDGFFFSGETVDAFALEAGAAGIMSLTDSFFVGAVSSSDSFGCDCFGSWAVTCAIVETSAGSIDVVRTGIGFD